MIVEKALNQSIRRRFGLVAGAVALSMASASSMAAIVYSGPVNIPIPDTIDGIYMNIVTGATGSSGGSVPGYDINPYSALAGQLNLWGPTTAVWLSTVDINGSYTHALGTIVGSGGQYFRPGGNIEIPLTANSSDNYLAFQFTNESTGATNYGWLQLQVGASPGTRAIIAYAYENAGASIPVGTTPVSLQNFSID